VNAFNRLIMLIIALLLIAVPVLLLLVGFGVLPANQISPYYRPALDSFGDLASAFSYDAGTRTVVGARTVVGLIGILVFLVALFLLLKEIPLGRRIARRAFIEEEPGRETAITSGAVRQLAEAAAREVGATSPTCYLASKKRSYDVACDIRVPRSQNFTELATRARDNIRRVLEEQRVPVRDVEVTVQGTASQE
jgi:hypothetical protein